MEKLINKINNAKGLDELIPLIEIISRETDAVLGKRVLKESDFEIILRPLATMRSLLSKLDLILSGPGSTEQAVVIRELAARCLDLEGKMKEKRNDRLRPHYAA